MVACLVAVLAWLLGVAWQIQEPALWPVWVYVSGLMLSLLLGLLWWGLTRRAKPGVPAWCRWVAGLLSVALLAWASTGWRASARMAERLPDSWRGQDIQVVVQVTGLPRAVPGGVLFDARALSWPSPGPDLPELLSLRMNTADSGLFRAGQRWQMAVRLHAPDGQANPGGFDATLPLFERGVRAVGTVRDRVALPRKLSDRAERPWQGVIDRMRQDIRDDIMARVADKRAAGVLAGLSVGDQSAIDRADWEIFRRTGVAHLVSISGAHIAMLGWLAAQVIRRVWARWPAAVHRLAAPDVAMWGAVCTSALYALLAGWGVPAQRTVWMMLAFSLLRGGGRRWPWPLVWLASALAVTVLDPWALWQPGFWLSYVAVGVLMSSGLSEHGALQATDVGDVPAGDPGWLRRAGGLAQQSGREMVRTQWLVTLALTPLAVVCFQQVSIVSFGANVGAIPLFTLVITPLSLLGAVWPPFWDLGAWLIQYAMARLAEMSAWPWAVVQAPALPFWVSAGAVIAGFAMAIPAQWAWRLAALPFFLFLLYLPEPLRLIPAPRPGQFQVLAADVGQGTAVLVRTAHHQLLFDAGPRIGDQSDAGERIILPLLRAMGIRQLDTLMISHEDTDHVGGAASLVSALPIAQLLSSLDEVHPLRQQASTTGEPLSHQTCLAGQHWEWDGVAFTVLHPTEADYEKRQALAPNALSCVLRVSLPGAEGASVLIAGDVEAAQEAALVSRHPASGEARSTLQSEVLISPHHGSKTSSTAGFLQAVQPRQVVIQVGRRNAYGHPSPSVLARYQAQGLNWQATPDCGAYLWSSDDVRPRESASGPQLGTCWRATNRHYWDPPQVQGTTPR